MLFASATPQEHSHNIHKNCCNHHHHHNNNNNDNNNHNNNNNNNNNNRNSNNNIIITMINQGQAATFRTSQLDHYDPCNPSTCICSTRLACRAALFVTRHGLLKWYYQRSTKGLYRTCYQTSPHAAVYVLPDLHHPLMSTIVFQVFSIWITKRFQPWYSQQGSTWKGVENPICCGKK